MRVLITRQVMISGESTPVGSSLDLPHALATLLINSGKATPEPESEAAPEPPAAPAKAPAPTPAKATAPAKAAAPTKPPAPTED